MILIITFTYVYISNMCNSNETIYIPKSKRRVQTWMKRVINQIIGYMCDMIEYMEIKMTDKYRSSKRIRKIAVKGVLHMHVPH